MSRVDSEGMVTESRDLECRSSCERKDHVLVDIALQQSLAEGWLGSYFTVHKAGGEGGDMGSVGGGWRVAGEQPPFTGGTMEWGLDEDRSICLPATARCYEVGALLF